jgi:hypothetical protein
MGIFSKEKGVDTVGVLACLYGSGLRLVIELCCLDESGDVYWSMDHVILMSQANMYNFEYVM